MSLLAFVIAANSLIALPLAQAQDFGNLDTARTLSPTYNLVSCQPSVVIKIPIYLYADTYYIQGNFEFHWTGDVTCDTIISRGRWAEYSTIEAFYANNEMKYAAFGTIAQQNAFPPTHEIVADVYLRSTVNTTFTVIFQPEDFRIANLFSNWPITIQELDREIVVLDTMSLVAGDCDCSGLITISDAVFLIQYIFSGGLPPYDLNSADPDASCLVTISDAVYLINCIFSGGPGPLVGCAGS